MTVPITDIKFYKDDNGGLGGDIDLAAEITSNVANNLFDKFTGAETSAGGTFYACFAIRNANATEAISAVEAFIASETDFDGVNYSLSIANVAKNTASPDITNENTPPAGVDFDTTDTDTGTAGAATADGVIALPDLNAGDYQMMWMRVEIDAGTAAFNNFLTQVQVDYDSGA